MTHTSNSYDAAHDTNLTAKNRNGRTSMCFTVQASLRQMLFTATIASLMALSPAAHAGEEKATPKKTSASSIMRADPLAKDVWHAMGSTWPGTITFNGKTKQVVLAPLGAQTIHAAYEVSKLETKNGSTTGVLKMSSPDGQVVSATFAIKGNKDLSLRFTGGQQDETYARMSPAEEEAEKARFAQMLEKKKLEAAKGK